MLTDRQLDKIGEDMLSFALDPEARNLSQFAKLYDRGKRWPSQIARKDYVVYACFSVAKSMLKFRRCRNLLLWEEMADDIADILAYDLDEGRITPLMEKAQQMEEHWEIALSFRLIG